MAFSLKVLKHRLLYSPFVAQLVVTRYCNLECGYCNEFDKVSAPIDVDVLRERLGKLKELGTWGITLTGGEPTTHPRLLEILRACRSEFRFFRFGMITNGIKLKRELVEALNETGMHELQISVDGVKRNKVTVKVLETLRKSLNNLREHAKFKVTVNAVVGACPPEEAFEVLDYAQNMGFIPRVILLHDHEGSLKLTPEELEVYHQLKRMLPKNWQEMSDYRDKLIHTGQAPFKCRAGSRYLYVDEHGIASWCSQTRGVWSKPLMDYTYEDLQEQFYTYKSCNRTCTIGCVRSASWLDGLRRQDPPGKGEPEPALS